LLHTLSGSITVNGEVINFTGGKGYLEKDWGQSFPENYVWVQANHFLDEDVSFFFSYAKIPYLGLKFLGLICHLYLKGKHYRFATYNGGKVISETLGKTQVEYVLKKGDLRLKFIASVDAFASLPSPRLGEMNHAIKEGLSGVVSIWLIDKKDILYQGESRSAGIEIMR
jgi:hypothetical protein